MRRTFHFSTVVWGPWHTGVYLDANLPSLLADGNLRAFAARHKVEYRIQTSREDAPRILASPVFQQAQRILDCRVVARLINPEIDPIGMHHILWRHAIEEGRRAGAMVLLIPPDVIWSNGAFGHIADVAATGKRAIFMTYMRVVSETAVPAIVQRFRNQTTGVIDVSSRALVDVAMHHIHPLTLTYVHDSPNFPIHPEFILWSVGGEGYLMRVLVREMFAYDPSYVDLNEQALPAHRIDPEWVHYITDSDDLFSVSLAPLAKDIEWYAKPQRLDALTIGSWWLRYDSPANALVAAHHFHIHPGERTAETWRTVERQSDSTMKRLAGTREALRVLSAFAAQHLTYAEQVLATAIAHTPLCRIAGASEQPLTVLLPPAAATYRHLFDDEAGLEPVGRRARLLRQILDHVIVGNFDLEPGHDAVVRTALDGQRRLTWRGEHAYVDDVAITREGFPLGRIWCYPIGGVLPASSGRRSSRSGHKKEAGHRREGVEVHLPAVAAVLPARRNGS